MFFSLSFSRETELLQEERDHAALQRVKNVNSNQWFKINVYIQSFLISDSIRSLNSIKKTFISQI